jgi:hypothetical protein
MAFQNTTYLKSFNAKGCGIRKGTITIPNKVEKCTKELLVYYTCDSVQKMGCADKNMLIGSCSIIDCQSTLRSITDNEFINVRAVDDIVIVDIKPFNWKRIANFFNEFVNDTLIIVNHAKATYLDFFVLWIVVCKKALDFFVYYFYLK